MTWYIRLVSMAFLFLALQAFLTPQAYAAIESFQVFSDGSYRSFDETNFINVGFGPADRAWNTGQGTVALYEDQGRVRTGSGSIVTLRPQTSSTPLLDISDIVEVTFANSSQFWAVDNDGQSFQVLSNGSYRSFDEINFINVGFGPADRAWNTGQGTVALYEDQGRVRTGSGSIVTLRPQTSSTPLLDISDIVEVTFANSSQFWAVDNDGQSFQVLSDGSYRSFDETNLFNVGFGPADRAWNTGQGTVALYEDQGRVRTGSGSIVTLRPQTSSTPLLDISDIVEVTFANSSQFWVTVDTGTDSGSIPEPSAFAVWVGVACCCTLTMKRRR